MCVEREGRLIGVLNDYDMATVMTPGSRYPERGDNTLAGTRPFMALDLLDYPVEGIKRWYRYDFESFTWCLAWMMLDSPPTSWLDGNMELLSTNKGAFMARIESQVLDMKYEWLSLGRFVIKWFSSWRSHYARLGHAVAQSLKTGQKTPVERIAIRNDEDECHTDLQHVQAIVEGAVDIKLGEVVEALQDISWINVDIIVDQ